MKKNLFRVLFWVLACVVGLCRPALCCGDGKDFVSTAADSWRANKEALPALEADLVIEFPSVDSGVAVKQKRDAVPNAGPTVVLGADPPAPLRYRVARALNRVRVIAQQPADPADPAVDMLFDGSQWQTVEKSGEHLVLRRSDQICGLGPLDPSSLPSSQLCADFAEEIVVSAAQAETVTVRSVSDDVTWLILHLSTGGEVIDYYIEFDLQVAMLPTRLWVNLAGNTVSLKKFTYKSMTTSPARLCIQRDELSSPRSKFDIAAERASDSHEWGRRVVHSLRDIKERQPHELAVLLEGNLTANNVIDLTQAPPIRQPEAAHEWSDENVKTGRGQTSWLALLQLSIVPLGLVVYLVFRRRNVATRS